MAKDMNNGAIVLCGGRSNRMGRDKATLPFGPECMLQRVVRLLAEVVELSKIVVVAAAGQNVPDLPPAVQIVRDTRPDRGPLEGLATGLRVLNGQVTAVYATSCDVPLLVPQFARRLFEQLDDHDIVVPREREFRHPLSAVYRVSVLPKIHTLLDADRLSFKSLFDEVRTREIPVEDLRSVDPTLSTLQNLNLPEDYLAALAAIGFPPSRE